MVFLFAWSLFITAHCQTSNDTTSNNMGVKNSTEYNKERGIKAFEKLMGKCNCKSLLRDKIGKWKDTIKLKWNWKYVMEGNGVYDEGWYETDDKKHHFSSMRVYDEVNKHWYVSYFTPELKDIPQTWMGGKVGKNIILKKDQKTTKGLMKNILTFSNITHKGFTWEGKIVNEQKKTEYIFWKIWCIKNE